MNLATFNPNRSHWPLMFNVQHLQALQRPSSRRLHPPPTARHSLPTTFRHLTVRHMPRQHRLPFANTSQHHQPCGIHLSYPLSTWLRRTSNFSRFFPASGSFDPSPLFSVKTFTTYLSSYTMTNGGCFLLIAISVRSGWEKLDLWKKLWSLFTKLHCDWRTGFPTTFLLTNIRTYGKSIADELSRPRIPERRHELYRNQTVLVVYIDGATYIAISSASIKLEATMNENHVGRLTTMDRKLLLFMHLCHVQSAFQPPRTRGSRKCRL